jgi:dephospho-CoA kinase
MSTVKEAKPRLLAAAAANDLEPIPLADRKTDELIIGLVGPIASGVSYTARMLEKRLVDDFGYEGRILKVSDLIKRNPEEVAQLRDVYGETFWLIGVFAPESIRKQRLLGAGFQAAYIEKIFTRDQDEDFAFGQHVRSTMQLADFFVRNDRQNDARLNTTIARFLEILFGVGIHTPTTDERSMNAAASAAAASACSSRQVGAVIVTKDGGCNRTGSE